MCASISSNFEHNGFSIDSQNHKDRLEDNTVKRDCIFSPIDIDSFIPWICLEYQAPQTVVLKRHYIKEESLLSRRSSTGKLSKRLSRPQANSSESKLKVSLSTLSSEVDLKSTVFIKSYYNAKNQLLEIAINSIPVCRKIIMAIGLSLPFHPNLTKISIQGRSLNSGAIYEINKLLPGSNITDICFDYTNVREGNYYILLDNLSSLKCLSLKRCNINDLVCKKIANRLIYGTPASTTLCALDLSLNKITNKGAKYIADALRSNRKLLHLNLAGNLLTDEGAIHILTYLAAFPLNLDDLIEVRHKRFAYFEKKKKIFEEQKQLYELEMKENNKENIFNVPTNKTNKTSRKVKKQLEHLNEEIDIERATNAIAGEFKHRFDEHNTFFQDNQVFAIGNFKLCSLNLAYNDLGYFTVKKVCEVIKYQYKTVPKPLLCTGLLRIILDGNNIPICQEIEDIQVYLQLPIADRTRISEFKLTKRRNKSLIQITSSTPIANAAKSRSPSLPAPNKYKIR